MKVKRLPETLRIAILPIKAYNPDPMAAADKLQAHLRAEWGWDVPMSLARDFIDAA